ncbi:formate/nitrite transporter family protein [Streptomyces sp. NPDC005435]|uniref:formate/nitrite transporter family protein n=1 Tax=Streptomyces sp. NPDC005435 TaxID=3154464 RepID=UPI003455B54E
MPIPLQHALEEQAAAARTKVSQLRSPGRYLLLSALAGAFVGVAGVLLIMVTGPLGAQHSAWTKLVQGGVFGIALILVVFAGSELCTGNVLTMTQGVSRRRVSLLGAVGVIVFSFIGNLIGSIVFAWLVHSAGVLDMAGVPGKPAPGATLLTGMLTTKIHESTEALFFRGVLCNFLVCLALWTAGRTRSDGAKIALIFWCLLAFIGSGFEHVVANMTYFSLGLFQHVPGVTIGAFARDLLFVGLGNLVGGAVLVGIAYGVIARPAKGVGAQTDPQTGALVAPQVAAQDDAQAGAQAAVPAEAAKS